MSGPLRVALPIVSSHAWQGGFNYQMNLARSLVAHAPERIQPVAFFGHDAAPEDLAAFSTCEVEVVCHAAFARAGQNGRLMRALLFGLDTSAATAFAERRINVVFEAARFYGRRLPQAAIAWFPDFQHRRLPHLFSRAAWLKRDIGFRVQLRHRRTILVSSDDARRDCERFYPESKGRTQVLRFPAVIDGADLAADPLLVRTQHGVPERFIYLPNQFWRHKNHALVVEALGILRQRGRAVTVVATGRPGDPREPELFDRLMARLDTLGARAMFRTLGIVPRTHVIAFLRSCTAILNPSICEGWSSGVEEAKVFGAPMILSDIPVHREQAGSGADYFPADDAAALADLLAGAVERDTDGRAPRLPRTDSEVRTSAYAHAFAAIAEGARPAGCP